MISDNSVERRGWNSYFWIFAGFTIYILFCVLQNVFRNLYIPQLRSWREIITILAVWAYTWAILTIPLSSVGRRFSISRPHLLRNLLIQLGFAVVFATVHRIIYTAIIQLLSPTVLIIPDSNSPRIFYFLYFISESFLDYLFFLAIHQAIIHFREVQQREISLQQAQLQALKAQLHPHFLFNTLNAISALAYRNPTMAARTIAELSDLLRFSLKSNKEQEISLKTELEFLRKYLQIQQTLLEERLIVNWNVNSETLEAAVPNMILQPLVENSIRHGIAPMENGGRVEITAARQNGSLYLSVRDDGAGLSSENGTSPPGEGLGIANTRARLRHLYGDAQNFRLSEPPDGGTVVNLTIPFRKQNTEDENTNFNR